jgi:hypothetical protein
MNAAIPSRGCPVKIASEKGCCMQKTMPCQKQEKPAKKERCNDGWCNPFAPCSFSLFTATRLAGFDTCLWKIKELNYMAYQPGYRFLFEKKCWNPPKALTLIPT